MDVACLCQRNKEGVCFDIHSRMPPLLRWSLNTIRFTDARIPPSPQGLHELFRKGIAHQWLLGSCRTNNEKKIFKLGLRNFLCDDARPGPHNGSDTTVNRQKTSCIRVSFLLRRQVRARYGRGPGLSFSLSSVLRVQLTCCLHVAYRVGNQVFFRPTPSIPCC